VTLIGVRWRKVVRVTRSRSRSINVDSTVHCISSSTRLSIQFVLHDSSFGHCILLKQMIIDPNESPPFRDEDAHKVANSKLGDEESESEW
jgi:hypothetical protein